MIEKEKLQRWATNKWWSDRGASADAYMDAMDGWLSSTAMTQKDRWNCEILKDTFWEHGGLDMAYQEYLERDLWERKKLTLARQIEKYSGFMNALYFCHRIDQDPKQYHRFGRNLVDRFTYRSERRKRKNRETTRKNLTTFTTEGLRFLAEAVQDELQKRTQQKERI